MSHSKMMAHVKDLEKIEATIIENNLSRELLDEVLKLELALIEHITE